MNAYTYSDVLIKPKYSEVLSRTNVDLTSDLGKFKLSLPIISANMKTITEAKMAAIMKDHGALGIIHRFTSLENIMDWSKTLFPSNFGISIGVHDKDKKWFEQIYVNSEYRPNLICIDVAHGHHIHVKNMLTWIKGQIHPNTAIMAGNIATAEAAYDLADWGADIIKVGIGPSPVCQTRTNTGVGMPQLYALECIKEQVVHQLMSVKIVADGGIKNVGDIAKALKYADAVMLGTFLSGTTETPGNVYKNVEGQYYKVYGGSAAGENKNENRFVEGITKTVPFRGRVKYILKEIKEGLQSSFSYVGAHNFKEYQEKCEFVHISEGSMRESKV